MTHLKKLSLLAIIVSFVFSLTTFISPVVADDGNFGLTETTAQGEVGKALLKETPAVMAGRIIGAVLSLVGVVFFLLVLYGGLRWMIAQGNEAEVDKAKQILVAAVIGLIIVLAAYAITAFIGNALTKAS